MILLGLVSRMASRPGCEAAFAPDRGEEVREVGRFHWVQREQQLAYRLFQSFFA